MNYRLLLNEEFANRKRKNPSYSLRAFSAGLSVSPSYLSRILSGDRDLSPKTASLLADRLCLSPDDRSNLLKSIKKRKGILKPVDDNRDEHILQADSFKIISDWYHYAILSLASVKGSRFDTRWIADRLNISIKDAESGIKRLRKLGLLETDGKKFWQSSPSLNTTADIASSALKKHHAQNLRKAEQSLEQDPVDVREFCSQTVAIDPKQLPEAKKIINEFRKRLTDLLEVGTPERVYTLAIQLFPVDNGRKL